MSILKRASWRDLLVVTSLAITVFSAFLAYLALQEPHPGVTFTKIAETDILDLHRPVEDLGIVFRGQDLQQQGRNLRIMTIIVENSGSTNIRAGDFDQNNEWGIQFLGGDVIEARLIAASTDYLKSQVMLQRTGPDMVTFPKIIFEKGQSFTIEVLLLHSKNHDPSVSPIGKIVGLGQISVVERTLSAENIGFLKRVFMGSPLVQLTRAGAYFAGSVVIMIGGLFALILVIEWREDRKKEEPKQGGPPDGEPSG